MISRYDRTKLTVYTNLIHGCRRQSSYQVGERAGIGQERRFHLGGMRSSVASQFVASLPGRALKECPQSVSRKRDYRLRAAGGADVRQALLVDRLASGVTVTCRSGARRRDSDLEGGSDVATLQPPLPAVLDRQPGGSRARDAIISLRRPPRCARAPQILHPTWRRCASACRPIPESIVARARLAGGCLETLIGPAFRQPHRPLTHSSRCPQVSSALRCDCQPFRKRPCLENLHPAGHAAPRGLLNPWQTSTSFPRDPAGAAATSHAILDAQPKRRSQMKGIPSCERLMPWL
jgi:hypothetical protein